jgi:predicted dehydrogenase
MLRFGVLGASHFALHKMIPALQAGRGIEVTAIASRDGAKAAEAARRCGVPRAFGSYEELLADPEVDAIYNPLPNHLHVPWSERAAAAGKHVLCEKPIALDASEAGRLLAVRDRARVLVCEAAMIRVHPRWLAVRELLRAGRIGELRSFVGTFGYKLPTRNNVRYNAAAGGGVLLDTGFYPVTLSRFCFGTEPTHATAVVDHDLETGVDRLTSAILRFPSGQAMLTTGMELVPVQHAQLIGTAGHLFLPDAWTPPPERPSELVLETSLSLEHPAPERMTFDAVNQYTRLGEAFAEAARTGGPGPIPLEDSIRNMAVLDALRRSAASGRLEAV